MDPLSIIGSVVGLVQAASSVTLLLRSIRSRLQEVPGQLRILLIEVEGIQAAIGVLDGMLQKPSMLPLHRVSQIPVNQLVAMLTEATLTVSELNDRLNTVAMPSASSSLYERLVLALKERDMATLVQRLQREKASLSLIFDIIRWLAIFTQGPLGTALILDLAVLIMKPWLSEVR